MRYFVLGAIVLFGYPARADAPVLRPPPVPPKVVTRAWLRETLQKKGALAQLIDDSTGVVVIENMTDSPNDNDEGRVSAVRLCGENLNKRWPKLEDAARYNLRKSDSFECQNKPGPPLCAFGVAYEYTTYTHLLFRPATDGTLRLDAVLYLDGHSTVIDKSSLTEEENYVQQQLTKLRRTDCAGKAATPADVYKQFRAMFLTRGSAQ